MKWLMIFFVILLFPLLSTHLACGGDDGGNDTPDAGDCPTSGAENPETAYRMLFLYLSQPCEISESLSPIIQLTIDQGNLNFNVKLNNINTGSASLDIYSGTTTANADGSYSFPEGTEKLGGHVGTTTVPTGPMECTGGTQRTATCPAATHNTPPDCCATGMSFYSEPGETKISVATYGVDLPVSNTIILGTLDVTRNEICNGKMYGVIKKSNAELVDITLLGVTLDQMLMSANAPLDQDSDGDGVCDAYFFEADFVGSNVPMQ